jgi:general stress protein CsbA
MNTQSEYVLLNLQILRFFYTFLKAYFHNMHIVMLSVLFIENILMHRVYFPQIEEEDWL